MVGMRLDTSVGFTLKDFLMLRRNRLAYLYFCENFLSCVVGKLEWKKCAHSMVVSNIASPTDEAFALLILENIWDSWSQVDIEDYYKWQVPRSGESGVKETKRQALVGKYTSDFRRASRFGGWSDEGHARFVQLRIMVIDDRLNGKKFEENFLEYQKDIVATAERKCSRKRKRDPVQKCIDDDLNTW
jgi:hypothetical protein